MKNSDMKIIAIILSIALFVTVLTSNAVSVASIAFLAKGETAQAGTNDNSGNAGSNNGGSSDVSADTNNGGDYSSDNGGSGDASVTPDASGSDNGAADNNSASSDNGSSNTATNNGGSTNTNTNTNTNTSSADNGSTQNKPSSNGGTSNGGSSNNGGTAANANNWDKAKVFNFYKAACDKITSTGAAGHTRKEWQEITALDLGSASNLIKPIIQKFMKSEDEAEAKVSAKGSDDAKRRMAPCGADISYVKSATKQDLANGNYKITIVMNDETSPKKGSNGIAAMATGILYMEDVEDTVKNDSTVSTVVKSLDDAKIVYKAYTIVAEMTKDGKFVTIEHNTVGDISASAKLVVGSMSGSGSLAFTSKWYDFKY